MKEMATDQQQIEGLRELAKHKGHGVLMILSRPGDVAFAVSPVPELRDYEIVFASPEGLYDLWKDGTIEATGLTREQVSEWLKENTPEWLYDDSVVTVEQKSNVQAWVRELQRRYPGQMVIGGDSV